jgi:hypothetical protein
LIDAILPEAIAAGRGAAVQYAHWASALVMNGLGRYEEALVAAVEATRRSPELHIASWALGELIEAATRTGDTELAASALTRLGEHTEGSDADWGLGIHARSSALVRDGDAAERLYARASSDWGAPGCARSSHGRICCTGSGCAGRAGASTPARSCGLRTTCS